MFRRAETLLLVYFIYTMVLVQFLPVGRRAARRVLATNMSILAAYGILGIVQPQERPIAIVRDWVALALTILCYEEMGWLVPTNRTYRLEKSWIVWDRRLLTDWGVKAAIEERCGGIFPAVLELSYALVYAMPVFGLVLFMCTTTTKSRIVLFGISCYRHFPRMRCFRIFHQSPRVPSSLRTIFLR